MTSDMRAPSEREETEVRRTFRALLAAVLDGDCEQRVRHLLHRDDDLDLGANVAHYAAHMIVRLLDEAHHEDVRAAIGGQLLELAVLDDA